MEIKWNEKWKLIHKVTNYKDTLGNNVSRRIYSFKFISQLICSKYILNIDCSALYNDDKNRRWWLLQYYTAQYNTTQYSIVQYNNSCI